MYRKLPSKKATSNSPRMIKQKPLRQNLPLRWIRSDQIPSGTETMLEARRGGALRRLDLRSSWPKVRKMVGWKTESVRRVRKLCVLAGDFMKWRLCDLPDLSRWVHPSGKVVLLGDSCHPMLPYLAQGAAQLFEDTVALRQCLALDTDIKSAQAPRDPRVGQDARAPAHPAYRRRRRAAGAGPAAPDQRSLEPRVLGLRSAT
ncbi:hypothetical protein F4821DRAFT_17540 [Hypoxylon rubiginosum]|uniref:Uncharacterized protein n=1 Tax=Hypoxylon rubiginosum TaxID=110542 RepID=A0ACC0CMY2_9PEZI|nr:hypothetical protein F4821DRAFT_17540 [Hypoxylon rubiginosum]